MKGSIIWIMLATASLVACGKSEEPAAITPPAQEAPQQAAPAQVEPVPVEAASTEAVQAPAETAPATQPSTEPAAAVKPAQPTVKTVLPAAKPLLASPAQPTPPSPAPKTVAAEPASAAPSSTPQSDLAHGQQIYRQACAFCHDKGIAGAPKTGDTSAWSARLAQGMSTLYTTALHGKGAMPAKGGNPALKDTDVKAAVDYLVAQAR